MIYIIMDMCIGLAIGSGIKKGVEWKSVRVKAFTYFFILIFTV
jgi:hypothetical protein